VPFRLTVKIGIQRLLTPSEQSPMPITFLYHCDSIAQKSRK